jgi:hypothetical protein
VQSDGLAQREIRNDLTRLCAGSDKAFPTVEGLLRSRTLTFPKPGELGAPGQPTFADTLSGGRVASSLNVGAGAAHASTSVSGVPLAVHRPNVGPGAPTGLPSQRPTHTPPIAASATSSTAVEPVTPIAPPPFPVIEAMEKVLACK